MTTRRDRPRPITAAFASAVRREKSSEHTSRTGAPARLTSAWMRSTVALSASGRILKKSGTSTYGVINTSSRPTIETNRPNTHHQLGPVVATVPKKTPPTAEARAVLTSVALNQSMPQARNDWRLRPYARGSTKPP